MKTIPVADLHSHYPMHLAHPDVDDGPIRGIVDAVRNGVLDGARGLAVKLARRIFSDPSPTSGPSISIPRYRHGGVSIACSALYSPFDELFARGRFLGPPVADDFATLLDQMRIVEASLRAPGVGARIVRNSAELAAAQAHGDVAIVHCVEGGFHLGGAAAEIDANAATLKARGVAYVTVAHLFYRQVATNAPALPFLSDRAYRCLFPQPCDGLTEAGRSLVKALHRHKILVDVTHMSERSFRDAMVLLADLDGPTDPPTPVIASHGACRIGTLEYNLTPEQVRAIAARDGVIGTILCDHYASDGVASRPSRTFDDSLATIIAHVRRIHDLTGSFDHVAIGSDHDGFIKPTLAGLEHPGELQRLARGLASEFGEPAAHAICHGNVERVLGRVL